MYNQYLTLYNLRCLICHTQIFSFVSLKENLKWVRIRRLVKKDAKNNAYPFEKKYGSNKRIGARIIKLFQDSNPQWSITKAADYLQSAVSENLVQI